MEQNEDKQETNLQRETPRITPASFGQSFSPAVVSKTQEKQNCEQHVDEDMIWLPNEVPHREAMTVDHRQQPRYEIYFRQNVGTEDVFLASSDKSPGSFDSSHIIVKVYFPGCVLEDLDLDVTTKRRKISSQLYLENLN